MTITLIPNDSVLEYININECSILEGLKDYVVMDWSLKRVVAEGTLQECIEFLEKFNKTV